MNTNSNSYTIIYASVMVVIVAFLLAFVSSSLRATQNKNVELDTKKQILAALNIKDVKDADDWSIPVEEDAEALEETDETDMQEKDVTAGEGSAEGIEETKKTSEE